MSVRSRFLLATTLAIVWMVVYLLPGCRKETEVVTVTRYDTVYTQPDMCPDTTLPINCYTTFLRGQGQRLPLGKEDTITVGMDQCITLGHCAFDTFIPTYRICLRAVSPGHIPDTAMCRAAGIPLCCPAYKPPPDDVAGSNADIRSVYFGVYKICDGDKGVIFTQLGQTQYLSHPDSNPNYSCQTHIQNLLQDTIETFAFNNCTFRLIHFPKQFDYDTVTVVYLPQGPPNALGEPTLIPCCAGTFKNPFNPGYGLWDVFVQIGLRCQ